VKFQRHSNRYSAGIGPRLGTNPLFYQHTTCAVQELAGWLSGKGQTENVTSTARHKGTVHAESRACVRIQQPANLFSVRVETDGMIEKVSASLNAANEVANLLLQTSRHLQKNKRYYSNGKTIASLPEKQTGIFTSVLAEPQCHSKKLFGSSASRRHSLCPNLGRPKTQNTCLN